MAETRTSPAATPKRKRDHLTTEMHLSVSPTPHRFAKTIFSFQPPDPPSTLEPNDPVEDGNSSPRSKVAERFRDLAIKGGREALEGMGGSTVGQDPESGGGAATVATGYTGGLRRIEDGKQIPAPEMSRFDFDAGINSTEADMQLDSDDDDAPSSRKRPKMLGLDNVRVESFSTTAHGEIAVPTAEGGPLKVQTNPSLQVSMAPESVTVIGHDKAGRSQKSYPSINRLADTKPRNRKRAGTPPLSSRRKAAAESGSGEDGNKEEIIIVDPVRAALTWREDEITVYDPEDKDDDGTGINGIGFKPTAAVAYQRAQRRRQQLAEYKKREESEARARRNQRRREQHADSADMKKHSMVRVHFSDAPPTTVMTT